MKDKKTDQAEPYFYIALVLKGTEKQYLNLLKYVNNRNGAQIIYQCKSLTYLYVTREDNVKLQVATFNQTVDAQKEGGKTTRTA